MTVVLARGLLMGQTGQLTFVSLMAANADAGYRQLMAYLTRATGVAIRVLDTLPWQERERLLASGEAELGAICGATYTRLSAHAPAPVRLLAAPVMAAARYRDQPVYFSDVVVRADSRFASFGDLRGAAWVFNEPHSFSGYAVVRAHLVALGETASFFGAIHESGAHLESLRMLLGGEADLAAIDSIVFERAVESEPALRTRLRTVLSLGPNPVPPLVFGRHVAEETAAVLAHALVTMHATQQGRAVLQAAGVARFAPAADHMYDRIRQQLEHADRVPIRPSR